MFKFLSSIVRFLLSHVQLINPTNATKGEMLQEIKKELQEELAELKGSKQIK